MIYLLPTLPASTISSTIPHTAHDCDKLKPGYLDRRDYSEVIVCDNSIRFSERTFFRMIMRIMKV